MSSPDPQLSHGMLKIFKLQQLAILEHIEDELGLAIFLAILVENDQIPESYTVIL